MKWRWEKKKRHAKHHVKMSSSQWIKYSPMVKYDRSPHRLFGPPAHFNKYFARPVHLPTKYTHTHTHALFRLMPVFGATHWLSVRYHRSMRIIAIGNPWTRNSHIAIDCNFDVIGCDIFAQIKSLPSIYIFNIFCIFSGIRIRTESDI